MDRELKEYCEDLKKEAELVMKTEFKTKEQIEKLYPKKEPREFWLRYDAHNNFLACHKLENIKVNRGAYTVHVREVKPIEWDKIIDHSWLKGHRIELSSWCLIMELVEKALSGELE